MGPNVSFLVLDFGVDFAKLPCVVVTVTIVFTNCFKPQTDGQAVMAWYFWLHTGFLHRPWILGRPWKVLKFHKTENVRELFWKTSGSSWKNWNLPMWNFQQDLVTWWLWELPATVAIKWVEELLRPLIINKCPARMLQICVFFLSSTSRVVCCRMIDWKKALSWPWIIEWKGLEKPWIFRSSGAGTLYIARCLPVTHPTTNRAQRWAT